MQIRSAPLFVALLLFFGLSAQRAFAESGDTLAGTGAVLSPGEEYRERWLERGDGLRRDALKTRSAMETLRAKMVSTRNKRATARRACRELLRRANRDARTGVLLQCYADDLTATRELFALQREEIALLPGVSTGFRSLAIQRLDVLDDAMQTIVEGIDVGVLGTEEAALETKHNLHKRYVVPALTAMTDARTDPA